jgi:hypothetical protein
LIVERRLNSFRLNPFSPLFGPADRHLPWRTVHAHRPIEAPTNQEFVVLEKLRVDAVGIAMVAQLAAPAAVIARAVELEAQLPRVRLPRRCRTIRRLEAALVVAHLVLPTRESRQV